MIYYTEDDYPIISDSNFITCTAKYCCIMNGEPMYKDSKGNYGILKKKNFHKFDFKDTTEFTKWYNKEVIGVE